MQRDPQLLGAVNMGNRWRVGDDCICKKKILDILDICGPDWIPHSVARLYATSPSTVDNLPHLCPPLAYVARSDTFSAGNQAGIPHHVRHQCLRIAANVEKLDTLGFDKVLEGGMRADTYSMSIGRLGQQLSNWYKRLNVPTRTDDEYGNVQRWAKTTGRFSSTDTWDRARIGLHSF